MSPRDHDREVYQAEYGHAAARTTMRIVGQILDGNVHLEDLPSYVACLEECARAVDFWLDRVERLKRERKDMERDAV